MAPGRGMLCALALATLVGCTVATGVEKSAEETLPRLKFRHSSSTLHPSEWIAGPNGYLYQFHIGEQSWLAAREFCLAQNADLVSIKTSDQLAWILQHYAPTHPSFDERYVQIGLVAVDGAADFGWVDGTPVDQSIVEWTTVPTLPHAAGTRCAQLKVNEKKVESVACDDAGSPVHINRFVCERSTIVHNEQQRSNNYIWRKLENLLNYFGFASENNGTTTAAAKKNDEEDDYWQAVETLTNNGKQIMSLNPVKSAREAEAALTLVASPLTAIEGSGQQEEKTISEANSASREEKQVDENALLRKDEAVESSKKEEKKEEIEQFSLPVVKEITEEVKAESVALPEKKKDEEDALNKPLPLRELLDTEEGSGAALTEAANIENAPETDSDLLVTATPANEADIDNMIDKMEKLLVKLGEKKEIGPIVIEKASTAAPSSSAATLIPIGPIIIEKASRAESNIVSGDEKVPDAAKEVEVSKEKTPEVKPETKPEVTDAEDSDLLVNLERTTLASTENKKSIDYDHKDRLEGDFTANGVEETAEMESLAVQVPVPKNSLNQEGDLNC
ncbi:hypothetical protein PFISCL1PPCAC_16203, partial [Pristionchus fissidentatus]